MIVKAIDFGVFTVTSNKVFHYYNENSSVVGMKMAIKPFVVQMEKDCFLVDTGFDFDENEEVLIKSMLLKNNVNPESVTKILMSHLHKDHSKGLMKKMNDVYQSNFPNATIYIQKREFDFALSQTEVKSYDHGLLLSLKDLPNIVWMEEDHGFITDNVEYQVTGGHSPFHQVFWFRENEEIYFFGGDNLPTKGFVDNFVAFKTDYDGKLACDYRKKWMKIALEENWKIMLYHDTKRDFLEN